MFMLSYCMNVHPTSSLDDLFYNIEHYALAVKEKVAPRTPFPLGLWFPAPVAKALRSDYRSLQALCETYQLYCSTINGFPYEHFHGRTIKQKVYLPDWSRPERLDYTIDLIELLSKFLPDGLPGSISTVPICYGKTLADTSIAMLCKAAHYARKIYLERGKKIWIALEPEPDCFLENSKESIAFFERIRTLDPVASDFIALCFDTCHFAIQGENLMTAFQELLKRQIPIVKVQLSAALCCDNRDGLSARRFLSPYDEETYLHQTRVVDAKGRINAYTDLNEALTDNSRGCWKVHFHLPLYFQRNGPLTSTADALNKEFLQLVLQKSPHIEIETYTFDVLPGPKPSIVDSIVDEFTYVKSILS